MHSENYSNFPNPKYKKSQITEERKFIRKRFHEVHPQPNKSVADHHIGHRFGFYPSEKKEKTTTLCCLRF